MARSITEIAAEYAKVRNQRRELEEVAADLKQSVEDPLRMELLVLLQSEGLQSVKLAGGGSVVRTTKSHYEILDAEKLCLTMFTNMGTLLQNGRPLTDALLVERRVAKTNVREFLGLDKEDPIPADIVAGMGLKYVEENDITLRKN
jgi:hypothetical protein